MNILKAIFVDEAIAICAGRFGQCWSNLIGFGFRLLEFVIVIISPLLISIDYSNKYSTVVASSIALLRNEILHRAC